MALEVVWRNPVPQPRVISDIELIALDPGCSVYIAHNADTAVVLRVDSVQAYRLLAEVRRAGGE
jgi:hypothetical protein